MTPGKFITIDGVEGAGKSTQIDFICSYLQEKGIEVIRTREPGGTELGEKIRSLLLGVETGAMHSDTELLLMFSDRNEHIQRKIKPALNAGKWVVSDRFTDASFAYQGGGRELDLMRISELKHLKIIPTDFIQQFNNNGCQLYSKSKLSSIFNL